MATYKKTRNIKSDNLYIVYTLKLQIAWGDDGNVKYDKK